MEPTYPNNLESNLNINDKSIENNERFGYKICETIERGFIVDGLKVDRIVNIQIVTKDGHIFSINKLLPEDWNLIRYRKKDLCANPSQKIIIYGESGIEINEYTIPNDQPLPESIDEEDFSRRVIESKRLVIEAKNIKRILHKGFFIELLHEIGHAINCNKMDPNQLKQLLDIRKKNIESGKLTIQQLEQLPDNDEYRIVLDDEQKAWDWALNMYKSLKTQGIDLAPEFTSEVDIINYIEEHLESYKDLSPESKKKFLMTLQ